MARKFLTGVSIADDLSIKGATLHSYHQFQSDPVSSSDGNNIFSVGGHGMTGGYSRNISIFSTTVGVWRSWVGTNLRWDGTNYKRASNQGNNNWGNVAGIEFKGGSADTDKTITFYTDAPESSSSGTLDSTVGTTIPTAWKALEIDNNRRVYGYGNFYVGSYSYFGAAYYAQSNTAYYVDPDGTSQVNKFRLNTTSDLQTGSSKLDVSGISAMRSNSTTAAVLYLQNHDSTTNTIQPYLFLSDGGGNRGALGVETSTAIMSINGQGGLKFQTGASGVSGTEALLIDNSQNATFAGNIRTTADIGRDDHNRIMFSTDNSIIYRVADSHRFRMDSDNFSPYVDSSYDLGTNTVRWRNLYADTLYGDGSNLSDILPKSIYLGTTTTGFLIKTNIVANNYAMFTATIDLEQFNVSSKQKIELSATVLNSGTVQSSKGTSDSAVTVKLFVYNSVWYIHVPTPSTYVTISAYVGTHNSYQGQANTKNEIAEITNAAVPSSGVTGSTDIVCKFSQGDVTFAGDILVGANYIGRDSDNYIGFVTDNLIKFRVNGATQVKLSDGVFAPQTDSDVDLGSSSTRFKDAFVDTITTTGNITVGGDLTVNGTTTTVNSTNLDLSDNIIGLNRGASSNANDSGLIIERGSTGDNAAFVWDESIGYFSFGTTQKTPSATGAVANESDWSWKPIKASGAIFTGSITAGGARSIFAADTVVNSFSGTAGVEVYKNAGDSILMVHQDDGNHESILHFRTGGNDTKIIVPPNTNALQIDTEQTTDAIVFGMDGSATFKGNVLLNSRLTFEYNGSGTGNNYLETGTNSLHFKNSSGTSTLGLNFSDQSATVGGDLTVSGGDITLGADVSIFRDGVNILRTDDTFHANNDIHVGGAGKIYDRGDTNTYVDFGGGSFHVNAHNVITSGHYLEFNAMGKLINMDVSGWVSGQQEHNILYSGWESALGDYLSIKVAGNSSSNHGNLIIGDNGMWYGRMNATDSAQATDSSTNPHSGSGSNYFRVNTSGALQVSGSVISPIFYDTNTSYYIDAASTSVVNTVQASYFKASTGSTSDPILRLTDTGVANYDVVFPDTNTYRLETSTSSTKTFRLYNAGSGSFKMQADEFVKTGGTSSQFLMADGSVSTGGGGTIDGSGAANRIAIWSDSDTLTSSASLFTNGSGQVKIGTFTNGSSNSGEYADDDLVIGDGSISIYPHRRGDYGLDATTATSTTFRSKLNIWSDNEDHITFGGASTHMVSAWESWKMWINNDSTSAGTLHLYNKNNKVEFARFSGDASSSFILGDFKATGSLRGTTFLDHNDTSYYVNPAGASNINSLTVGEVVTSNHIYGRSVNAQYSLLYRFGGLFFTWDSDSYGTNFQHSITSTKNESYGDNITLNSYGDVRINIDTNNNGTNTFSVGAATLGSSGYLLHLDESGHLTTTGSVRGPIFYDSNDTNYSIDLASTTTSIVAAGKISLASNKAVDWGGGSIRAEGNTLKLVATTLIDLQDNTQIQGNLDVLGGSGNGQVDISRTSGAEIRLQAQSSLARIGAVTNNHLQLFTNDTGRWNIENGGHLVPVADSSYNIGTSSVRAATVYADYLNASSSATAPVFYDSDNTGYYVNPAGDSTLSNASGTFYRSRLSASSNLAVGWYTIAVNAGNRAQGRFRLTDRASSRHQAVEFLAAHHYGNNDSNTITVLDNSAYGTDIFRYIRIKEGGTYEGAAIQVYIDNATNVCRVILEDQAWTDNGWILKNFVADASDPGDVGNYSNLSEQVRVDLDDAKHNGGINTTGKGHFNREVTSENWMKATQFYDYDNTAYYTNPAGTSVMNDIELDDYIYHKGDTHTYFGFTGNDAFTMVFEGQTRLSLADSTDPVFTYDAHINMSGKDIDQVNQLHFQANVRFVDSSNDSTLDYKYGDTGYGQIKFKDGNNNATGTLYAESGYFGTLSPDQSWAVQSSNTLTNIQHQVRSPIFYDLDNTAYYADPSATSVFNIITSTGNTVLGDGMTDKAVVHGHFGIGDDNYPKIAYPGQNALWGGSGATTGQIVIDLPGTLNNYDMMYMEIDIYEYSSTGATKLIIGGHNWNSSGNSNTSTTQWYNVNVQVVGALTKPVYFGRRNDGSNERRCIAIGETTSTWSYATVHVSKVHGAEFYSTAIDWVGDWNIAQTTSTSYFTKNPTTNFNDGGSYTLETNGIGEANHWFGSTSVRSPIFYDLDNTSYYLDPASTSTSMKVAGSVHLDSDSAQLQFGDDNDMQMFNNGANGKITNGTGGFYIGSDTAIGFQTADHGTNYLTLTSGLATFVGDIQASGDVRGDYFVGTQYASEGYTIYKGYDNWNHMITVRGHTRPGQSKAQAAILGGHQTSFVEYAESNDTTGWFYIGSSGTTYEEIGKVTKSYSKFVGSLRAPLFYDSDNTAYYVDPNGQSRINTLNLGSSPGSGVTSGYIAQFRGSLHMTNNNIDYVNQLHFHDNVRFYDDGNDSYLNFKFGDTSAGGIKMIDGDGNLHGYFYADGNSQIGILDNGGSWAVQVANDNITALKVADVYRLKCTTSEVQTYGILVNDTSVKAPIYYDSNNTGYYIDPASTSNVNNLTVNGTLTYSTINAGVLEIDGRKVLDMPSNSAERGPWNPIATFVRGSGTAVYGDEDFASSSNGVGVYNNQGGTGVVHVRETDGTTLGQTAPNSSGYVIRIVNNGNNTSPGRGGFVQTISSSDNDTYVQLFQAKLESGKTLEIAENSQGSNNTSYWLSDNAGTGKFEWYVRVSHCGNSGTFSSGGHVYVNGGSANEVFTWYLASSEVYKVTDAQNRRIRNYIASSSVTSPIYYDTNTSYYIDPAGTTSLRTRGAWHADSHTWSGEQVGKIQYHSDYWYMQTTNGVFVRNASGANNVTLLATGVCTANNDWRAPQFYDSANTSYLLDPNGDSVLHGIGIDDYLFHNGDGDTHLSFDVNQTILTAGGGKSRFRVLQTEIEAGQEVGSNTVNYNTVLRLQGKNNYSDGTNWYGNYGQLIFNASTNMTSSARRYLFTNAYQNNQFAIVQSTDTTTDPAVNTDGTGVRSGDLVMSWNNSRDVTIHENTRSPIYYDSNDTNYYLNPNNTAISLYVAGSIESKVKKQITASISNSYVRVYEVGTTSSQLASAVRVTGTAHGNSHVGNFTADILLNHSQDVSISSQSGAYTQGTIKVESDNNGAYTMSYKTTSSNAATYYFTIEALSDEISITKNPTSTPNNATVHEHTTNFGSNHTGEGGTIEHKFTGKITSSNDVVAFSDERLKSNIKTLDGSKVYEMRGVSFTKDNEAGSGVIAQELEKIAPELVSDGEYKAVAYGNITGYLIEAIKDLKAEIEELKKQIK